MVDVTNCYNITTTKGEMVVTKAALTVTAQVSKNQMTYGDEVPTQSATYLGFVNGEMSLFLLVHWHSLAHMLMMERSRMT